MAKKNQTNFYNLDQYEANCQNNKYLKALVLSYFCITREMDLLEGLNFIESEDKKDNKGQSNWQNLYEEYKRYHAGEDIQIESEKQDLFDPSLMESIAKENSHLAPS